MSRKNEKLRCEHIRADGKRCALPRSPKHDSLCVYHARAEEKLASQFARTPEAATLVAQVLGADHDFRTVTSVNDFIAKIISLRARKLIHTRDAAIFAYMAQLLLISHEGVKSEFTKTYDFRAWDELLRVALTSSNPGDAPPPPKRRRFKMARTRKEFAEQVFSRLGIKLPAFDPRGLDPVEDDSPDDESSERMESEEGEPQEAEAETVQEEAGDYADRTS
jgi:hypothetical protein